MKRDHLPAVAALALAAACIDLTTNPDEIVAIRFEPLPWPSIVAGDTLRDSTGTVARLTAQLFNGAGDPVASDGAVEFLSQDTAVRIVNGDLLVALINASGTARLLASAAGVQSVVRQIDIVPRPDSMASDGTIVPLEWVVPDSPQQNVSGSIGVRVLSHAAGTPATGVKGWIVTFQLEVNGHAVPATDTSQVFLVGDTGAPSYADTTDAFGRASRRVRVRVAPGLTPPDSALITMQAFERGASLAGAPVTRVLPIRAR